MDYNLYCYWRSTDYQLVPRDMPVEKGSMIGLGTDMVQPVRKEIRELVDMHLIQGSNGVYSSVMRYGRDSYFESMKNRPIYASLDHINSGVLAGVVETARGAYWLLAMPRKGDERVRGLLYEMWSGFIGIYDRLIMEIESHYAEFIDGSVEVYLNFEELEYTEDYLENLDSELLVELDVNIDYENRNVEVKFPSLFLIHFQQPDNAGEKMVLHAIAKGLIGLHSESVEADEGGLLDDLVEAILGDTGMRLLHMFRTFYPVDVLLSRQKHNPVFLAHEEFVFSKLMLSEGCLIGSNGQDLAGKVECNDFLHKVVDKVWDRIRTHLHQLDRLSVIVKMVEIHESIINDREHWNRTAQAILALYAPVENVLNVAQKRESDRNNVSLPARTIIEMAVCECPIKGGRQPSKWDLDKLLAQAALLIEVAMDSDAINSDLVEPKIYLHENGEYEVDRSFHKTVISPFQTPYFQEEFKGSAKSYKALYKDKQPGEQTRAEDVYSSGFIQSFQFEFGLTPDEAVDGFAELMDLAVEQDSVVVKISIGDLKERLTKNRGLSVEIGEAFIRTFSIYYRPNWDKPPAGFKGRDINPWRFRRRLSATARPIFVLGEKSSDVIVFGAGAFRLGFSYLLDRSERGHLPQEFFVSSEMKKYIGTVNSERGLEFARSVADKLKEKGWSVRNEVQMTELGASAEYGDIDVLAWRTSGEILLIECKRLQLARTVAEVAEICRRFRGEAKDEL